MQQAEVRESIMKHNMLMTILKQKILPLVLIFVLAGSGCARTNPPAANEAPAASETTVMQDGTYPVGTFRWSGGSGRVTLSCEQVTITDGQAKASVTFSSPNYEYAKIGETILDGTYTDTSSTFEVPIQLDRDIELIGCTTAMSKPHEITYTIYVSLTKSDTEQTPEPNIPDDTDAIREQVREAISDTSQKEHTPPDISFLTYDHTMELQYAKCFDVYYYNDGFKVLSVIDGSDYLIVPEGAEIPKTWLDHEKPDNMTVLQQPLDRIYTAATSSMSLFDAIKSLDHVKMTGTNENGWDIAAPKKALRDGTMRYAGKYSEPDYEMLVDEACDLAVESTMILHSPSVKEQLNRLGIPVLTDWSSYETDVQGRMEWIRAYGALLNREDAAEQHLQNELDEVGDGYPKTGRSIAYFSINSRNMAVVPRSDDYMAKMLTMGGADDAFSAIDETTSNSASLSISMEEFYQAAVDADVLIYNANIQSDVKTFQDLVAKNELLAGFSAVRSGNVYLLNRRLYQSSDCAIEFVNDVHKILTGNETDLVFLEKLN